MFAGAVGNRVERFAGPLVRARRLRSRANLQSPSRSAVGGYAVSVKAEPIEETKESGIIFASTGREQRLNNRAATLRSKITRWGREASPAEESAGAGGAIVEAASQHVTRLGGSSRGGGADRLAVESSNARTEHRRSEQPVSMNFGPQSCGAVPRHDWVRRGCSKIITIFQWVLIFEQ
jgi:hypothetical protein